MGMRVIPEMYCTTWPTASAARGALASSSSTWENQKNDVYINYFRFEAMVTKATPINLANHVYFNLAGHKTGAAGINRTLMWDTWIVHSRSEWSCDADGGKWVHSCLWQTHTHRGDSYCSWHCVWPQVWLLFKVSIIIIDDKFWVLPKTPWIHQYL